MGGIMNCRDCEFISEPEIIHGGFPSVRCTLGLWDTEDGAERYYSYGQSQLNRGPVRKLGEACTKGREKKRGGQS